VKLRAWCGSVSLRGTFRILKDLKMRKNVLIPAIVFALLMGGAVTFLLLPSERDSARSGALRERVDSLEELVGNLNERLSRIEVALSEIARAAGGRPSPKSTGAGQPVTDGLLARKLEQLKQELETIRTRPLKSLLERIAGADPKGRREAVKMLGLAAESDPEALKQLRRLLDEADSEVRAEAVKTLRESGDRESVDRIVELLGDEDPRVRAEAVKTLRDWGVVEAVPALEGLVGDEDTRVRREAVAALTALEGRRAVPLLEELLSNEDAEVRREAALRLAELGDRSAVGPLEAIYKEGAGKDRTPVVLALRALGDEGPYVSEVQRLIRLLQSDQAERVRRDAARDLGKLAPREARNILTKALSDPSPGVRKEAKKALDKLGT